MKKNYSLTLLLCSAIVFTSSAQYIQWQNTIGTSSNDYLWSVAQTADGGYICGGHSSSNISGDKAENSMGGDDYWILKLDPTGNIQWQNTIGGNLYDELKSIVPTPDGGYICGGTSTSNISGDKTENCWGWRDFWVVKLNASGGIQWQKTIGGDTTDELEAIKPTPDGGYICGGYSDSNISGDKTENNLGSHDFWVVKLNASGNIQWQNTIGGTGNDVLNALDVTPDGGFICGGFSYSNISGDKTENCLGANDYWVVKLDSAGNIQWQNTIGGVSLDYLQSIAATLDGGYICGGFSSSGIGYDKSEICLGNADYWVVKLDAAGNIQWQNTIGGNLYDYLYVVSETSDNGYICGGMSQSNISGDKRENSLGSYDFWIVKLDAFGNIEWQNTIGGNYDDNLTYIEETASGEYICGGYSNSNLSGDKTENSMGTSDYWVVKLTEHYNSITGNLFADINSNGLHDMGEPTVYNHRVNEINTGAFTFSDQNGDYDLAVVGPGNFSFAPANANYFTFAPTQDNAYFTGIDQTDSLNDFAFQPAGSINDLCVSITPPQSFRAGFNCTYQIHYSNEGNTSLTPTIIFRKSYFLSYVSASDIPSFMNSDSIIWNLPSILPLQQGTIILTLHVAAGTPIGTPVICYARIEPIAGDVNPGCNFGGWEPPLFVTASLDPNEIVVNLDTLTITELASAPFLQYIIYFQNTGTDTAFTVRAEDVLPASLDASTLELIGLSHAGNVQYDPLMRKVIFQFDNILLPDSNVNEEASHGYIHYRIKPVTSLIAGDTVKNQAGIYFDFNAPVITNIAQTQIVMITGIENSAENNSILIYPNPARSELVVRGSEFGDESEIIIYNLLGEKLFSQKPGARSQQYVVNVSALPRGIYFIKVKLEEKITMQKIVLM